MVNRYRLNLNVGAQGIIPREKGNLVLYSDYKILEDKYMALQLAYKDLRLGYYNGLAKSYHSSFYDIHD